jgi:hypothetical protein
LVLLFGKDAADHQLKVALLQLQQIDPIFVVRKLFLECLVLLLVHEMLLFVLFFIPTGWGGVVKYYSLITPSQNTD